MPITLGILAQSRQAVATGAFVLLESTVLGSAQASVEFTNLTTKYAATYQHLQIRAVIRGTRADVADQLGIQMNADGGANYSWHYMESRAGSGTVASDAGASQSNIFAGWMPANTATANAFGSFVTDILDPFETTKNKTIRHMIAADTFSGIALHSGARYNTASLTSISYFSRLGGNFAANTRFSLYGIKATA
jgi:hypothetical protein